MRTLILILLLCPVSLTAQKHLKKAEKETNKCIEAYTQKNGNGVEWKEIQAYFENYLYLNSIQKKEETIEKGYINYIRLRKNGQEIPPMPGRKEFKEKLVKAGILNQSVNLIGNPLSTCFAETYKKYKNQLPKKSTFVGIAEMLEAIGSEENISPALIAGGLEVAFKESGISHPLYKKVVILTLFIDAIYLEEILSGQISKENPYKSSLTKTEHSKDLEVLRIVEDEIDNEVTIEMVESPIEIEEEGEEEIFMIVEKMPQFPGGDLAFRKYIAKNIVYPKEAREKGIQEKIYIRFCITKTGEVAKISIARGVDPSLNKEAIRVIKSLPKWTPGEQRGKKVNVWYTIPVNFSLN